MYIEQNSTKKWIAIAAVILAVVGVMLMSLLLNRRQNIQTPASTIETTQSGKRSIVCRWETSQISADYSVILSLLDKTGKVIRAIPNPTGGTYTFSSIDESLFPTRCKLELIPLKAGLDVCVDEAPVSCLNGPTSPPNTPTPIGPTSTPGGPTSTPAPSNTPLPPTSTPIPTITPLPTNTPVPPTNTPKPTATIPPIGGPNNPTNTPVPKAPTSTPKPLAPTSTPIPTNTLTPSQNANQPELPKAGINVPTLLGMAIAMVLLMLAFAL